MSQVVIGAGEVGIGLWKVVGGTLHDPFKQFIAEGTYEVMHVCIPYSETFNKTVREYQKKFKPTLTIIHSSVPIGTSRKLKAVHSPIRGVHPNLDKGIRTFVKYFGGKGAGRAAKLFEDKGVKTFCTTNSEDTEALKLWDTTQYGFQILLNRRIFDWCKKHKRDFNLIYTHANQSYNEGYVELDRPEVVRPWLKHMPGKIGGHCVRENSKLLDKEIAEAFDKSV